ncbi:hypothetical protein D6789_04315 [Candidatus Woesearchaeota archaeon]|nr:MAG: hypothetical protein D6789_04315 [Candidatus Woesearchaeota archaeon]
MNRLWAILGMAFVLTASYGASALLGSFKLPGLLITVGLVGLLVLAQKGLSEAWFASAAALILALGVHMAFGPEWALFGVTHDVFLHFIAAFVAALLAHNLLQGRRHPFVLAVLVALVLGFGVELLEFLDAALHDTLSVACASRFCPYWQDTVKDLVVDLLGALAFVGAKKA